MCDIVEPYIYIQDIAQQIILVHKVRRARLVTREVKPAVWCRTLTRTLLEGVGWSEQLINKTSLWFN